MNWRKLFHRHKPGNARGLVDGTLYERCTCDTYARVGGRGPWIWVG